MTGMPIDAKFSCGQLSFRITGATITEAVSRAFDVRVTFIATTHYEASLFFQKECQLYIDDVDACARHWVGSCIEFESQHQPDNTWVYTCVIESMLGRLRHSAAPVRTHLHVNMRQWLYDHCRRHQIFRDTLHFRFDYAREFRPHLIQIHENDYDYFLRILAQEKILMWPDTKGNAIHFARAPDQLTHGYVDRIEHKTSDELMHSGGVALAAWDGLKHSRHMIHPDERDPNIPWEDNEPTLLYSGIPYVGEVHQPVYDRITLKDMLNKRAEGDGGRSYIYFTMKSNSVSMTAGNLVDYVNRMRQERITCRIQYVKHHVTSFGRSLRYHNELILQPQSQPWNLPCPPPCKPPLTMQGFTEGCEDGPYLNERGEEKVILTGEANSNHRGMFMTRMRPSVGDNYGISFPLGHRVEVLVSFLYGEPDMPVILGALPNKNMPSVVTSSNPQDYLIKTRRGHVFRMFDDVERGSISLHTSANHGLWLENGYGIRMESQGSFSVVAGQDIQLKAGNWKVNTGKSLLVSAKKDMRIQTTEADLNAEAASCMHLRTQKGLVIHTQNSMELTSGEHEMHVGGNANIRVQTGQGEILVSGPVTIQAGKDLVIRSDTKIVAQTKEGNAGLIMTPDAMTLWGDNFLGIDVERLQLKGNVNFGGVGKPKPIVKPMELGAVERKALNHDKERVVLHHLTVPKATSFYGKTVNPGDLDDFFFHIAQEAMPVMTFIERLYEESSDEKARAFRETNPHVGVMIEPGQMVFVVNPKSHVYQRFSDDLKRCARDIEVFRKHNMTADPYDVARRYALYGSFAESVGRSATEGYRAVPIHESESSSDTLKATRSAHEIAGSTTSVANAYFGNLSKTIKYIDDSYKKHGLSDTFIRLRDSALKAMDKDSLRTLDKLVQAESITPSLVAKTGFEVKNGMHRWMPTANTLVNLEDQYKSVAKASRLFSGASRLLIGIDGAITYHEIESACTALREDECTKLKYEEWGGFIAKTAVNAGAGFAVAALLAPASGGLSFAVAVGVSFAVDYFTSNAAQQAGKHGGTIVYQIKYEDRSQ